MRTGVIVFLIMIPSIQRKIKALQAFQDQAHERVIEQVRNRENYVLFLVREEQLFRGIDSEGKRIRPPYTPFTVSIKRQKNQPTNRVTLLDTGDFYDAMEVVFDLDKFFVINTDRKEQKLRGKYGDDILGMNERSRDLLSEVIKPDLIEDFKQTVL